MFMIHTIQNFCEHTLWDRLFWHFLDALYDIAVNCQLHIGTSNLVMLMSIVDKSLFSNQKVCQMLKVYPFTPFQCC